MTIQEMWEDSQAKMAQLYELLKLQATSINENSKNINSIFEQFKKSSDVRLDSQEITKNSEDNASSNLTEVKEDADVLKKDLPTGLEGSDKFKKLNEVLEFNENTSVVDDSNLELLSKINSCRFLKKKEFEELMSEYGETDSSFLEMINNKVLSEKELLIQLLRIQKLSVMLKSNLSNVANEYKKHLADLFGLNLNDFLLSGAVGNYGISINILDSSGYSGLPGSSAGSRNVVFNLRDGLREYCTKNMSSISLSWNNVYNGGNGSKGFFSSGLDYPRVLINKVFGLELPVVRTKITGRVDPSITFTGNILVKYQNIFKHIIPLFVLKGE